MGGLIKHTAGLIKCAAGLIKRAAGLIKRAGGLIKRAGGRLTCVATSHVVAKQADGQAAPKYRAVGRAQDGRRYCSQSTEAIKEINGRARSCGQRWWY